MRAQDSRMDGDLNGDGITETGVFGPSSPGRFILRNIPVRRVLAGAGEIETRSPGDGWTIFII
jgi:hypothetical protein